MSQSAETLSAKESGTSAESLPPLKANDLGLAPTSSRPSAPAPTPRKPASAELPFNAVVISLGWLAISAMYIGTAVMSNTTMLWSPGLLGGIIAGVCAPLLVIWLVVLYLQRQNHVDEITAPVRRQLHALLAPGAAADARVKRITQALAEQAEVLRHSAGIALDDSSAAMVALNKQSTELKRLSGESIDELSKIARNVEATIKTLQSSMGQIYLQTGSERERALGMVTELEKQIKGCLSEVGKLSSTYEDRINSLSKVSDQLEGRTKSLVSLTSGLDEKLDSAATSTLRDLDRLEAVVAELSQRSAAIAHQLGRPVDALETAARNLDANMHQSQEMLVSATRNLEKIGDGALSRASTLVTTLAERLSSMELVGAKMVSISAATQSETGRYVSQVDDIANRIKNNTDQGYDKLRQVLREFEDLSIRALDKSTVVAESLRGGADTLSESMRQTEERFDALAWDIEARSKRLGELSRDSTGQLDTARQVLDAAQDSFSTQIEKLAELTSRLESETKRADAGTLALSAAGEKAGQEATRLVSMGEQTRQMLGSIESVIVEQQVGVQQIAASLTAQLNALTASIVAQQNVLKQSASEATEGGEAVRASLRAQVQSISEATVSIAGQMDKLHARMVGEQDNLRGLAIDLEDRLTSVVTSMKAQGDTIVDAERQLGAEQRTLADIADAANQKIGSLNTRLTESQREATLAMDMMAERLAVLRGEVEKADAMLLDAGAHVSTATGNLTEEAGRIDQSFANVQARLETLSNGLTTTGDILGAQAASAERLLQAASEGLRNAGGDIEGQSASASTLLQGLGDLISTRREALASLETEVARLTENLEQRSQSMREELRQGLAEGLERMSAALQQSDTMFNGFSERLATLAGSVSSEATTGTSLLEGVMTTFREASDEFTKRVLNAEQEIAGVRQQLDETGANVSAHQQQLLSGAEGVTSRLTELASSFAMGLEQQATVEASLVTHRQRADELNQSLAATGQSAQLAVADMDARLGQLGLQATAQKQVVARLVDELMEHEKHMRESGESAAQVLRQLQGHILKAGQAGFAMFDKTETRLSETLIGMTTRLSDISRYGDGLIDRLRNVITEFGSATSELGLSGSGLTSVLKESADDLTRRAEGMVALGSELGQQLQTHSLSAEHHQTVLSDTINNLKADLADIDTRTNGYLVTLQSRSAETLESLRDSLGQLSSMPDSIRSTSSMLIEQILAARNELVRLRHEYIETGSEVQSRIETAGQAAARLVGQVQDVATTAELAGSNLTAASEALSMAAESSAEKVTLLTGSLTGAESRALSVLSSTDERMTQVLSRIDTLALQLESELNRAATSAREVAENGTAEIQMLVAQLDAGAHRVSAVSSQARDEFAAAVNAVSQHERAIDSIAGRLGSHMTDVKSQLSTLLEAMSGMDARLDALGPNVSSERQQLESFRSTLEATLAQVAELHLSTSGVISENKSHAAALQQQQETLLGTVGQLESRLQSLESGAAGQVVSRIQQAVEQTGTMETQLTRLTGQAGHLEGALGQIRSSLEHDVKAMQAAEGSISKIAETMTLKLLDAGTALNATLAQLQRGGQMSQAGLLQANEETQRLVVRLEQVRALVKNMMGNMATELSEWQFDLKRRMAAMAEEVNGQLARVQPPTMPEIKALAPVPAATERPRVSVQAISAPLSPAVAISALHAISVDLYRLLQTEVPELSQELMPVPSRNQPMTPEESQSYTKVLADQTGESFTRQVRDLAIRREDFRQYIERYLSRFDQLMDSLSRHSEGAKLVRELQESPLGILYGKLTGTLIRKPASTEAA